MSDKSYIKELLAATKMQEEDNKERLKSLRLKVVREKDHEPVALFSHVKQEDGSFRTVPEKIMMPIIDRKDLGIRAMDSILLSHEISEAEAVTGGSVRPLHTHSDVSVLTKEYDVLRRFPDNIRKQFMDTIRVPDINRNLNMFQVNKNKRKPSAEQLLIDRALSGDTPTLRQLSMAYDESVGQARSYPYRGYILTMLQASKKNPSQEATAAHEGYSNILHESLRKNIDDERPTIRSIKRKSMGAGVAGGALGALLGASLGLIRPEMAASGAVVGALAGGAGGSTLARNRAINKAYFDDPLTSKSLSPWTPLLKESGDDSEEPTQHTHSHSPSEMLRPRSEAIIYDKGGVLAINKGQYLLMPGGGVADGETPRDSAIRESMEEASAILKNIVELDVVSTTYDKGNQIMPGWDGESTHFFMALYGGDAKMKHPDKEEFRLIPFDDCIELLNKLINDPSQKWAAENNKRRLEYITKAKKMVNDKTTFDLKKYAAFVGSLSYKQTDIYARTR